MLDEKIIDAMRGNMLLFLDSNIICSNYYMAGPSFEVAKRVGTIVLGQIVVDEVCNKIKRTLRIR